MKIAVDAGCLGVKNKSLKTGVYQMTFQLLKQLTQIDKQNQYCLYSFYPLAKAIQKQLAPMNCQTIKPVFGWNHLALPLRLVLQKPDLFLGPSQSLPFFSPCPTIVIIHDLAFEHLPRLYPNYGRRLQKITQSSAKKAFKIIAVSQATKKDLKRLYHIPSSKIKVSYEGYDQKIFRPQPGRKQNYFLFAGSLKPSKNIPGLLAGFSCFLKKTNLDFQLTLAGSQFWLDPDIKKTIKKFKLKKHVKLKGYVSQKELVKLYQRASALVSPSFFEGFGLPVLEAMACGCPVIASQKGAAKEVVGSAGILINPRNIPAIGQAMIQAVKNQPSMIKKGIKQAKKFSWQNFSQDVLEVINETNHHHS